MRKIILVVLLLTPFLYAFNTSFLEDLIEQRNTIFAQHGYVFKSTAMQEYFQGKNWYRKNPRFTWRLLTAKERKQVAALKKQEDKLVALYIDELTRFYRKGKARQYKNMNFASKFPPDVHRRMMKKISEMSLQHEAPPPMGTVLSLSREITGKKFQAMEQDVKKKGKDFSYYELRTVKGKMRVVHYCHYTDMLGINCPARYHLNDDGKVVLADYVVPQTTMGVRWYVQYFKGKPVWIIYTLSSMNQVKVQEKFYP